MTDQRNLILAIALSIAILLGFQFLYEVPRVEQQRQQAQQAGEVLETEPPVPRPGESVAPAPPTGPRPRAEVVAEAPRVRIDTPRLHGSINLIGGRIDDLTLADYHVTPDRTSPEIELLSPAGSPQPYYAEFGWVPETRGIEVPPTDAQWTAEGGPLRPGVPVTLTWSNSEGLTFERVIEVDENYLFTVTQRVRNDSGEPVTLYPYGLVSRHGDPQTEGFFILHEGPLGVFDNTLSEFDYDDLRDRSTIERSSTGGWLGITDKYWLTALIPDQSAPMQGRFLHRVRDGQNRYQVDYLGPAVTVAPGASTAVTSHFFAGAKEVKLLDQYSEQYNNPLFNRAIDFGWFWFLTIPFFHALNFLAQLFGNFGVAILVFTVFIKLLFFPLANKSYRAMSRMKALQPQIQALQERFGNDRQRLSQEMMALYKREKVNPVSGCLSILIQIPVFFALYKVLFVTIEMRHAPFFGWIRDLSAPDPTSIFNLFGLLSWDTPAFLTIGVWPIIMGVTMYLQQRLNPTPPDPIQAKIFMALPFVFTFMLASFPAGLVIYWAWNNALSILQQWVIMKRMGVKVT